VAIRQPTVQNASSCSGYAPARHDRRLFGVLQLHRPASEAPFDVDEQHTASYIATQLGRFLADHSKRVAFDEDQRRRRR
jgi:hypothetical protein